MSSSLTEVFKEAKKVALKDYLSSGGTMSKKKTEYLTAKNYVAVDYNELYNYFRNKYNIILKLEWFSDKGNDVLVEYWNSLSLSEDTYEYKVITEELRRLYPREVKEQRLLIKICI